MTIGIGFAMILGTNTEVPDGRIALRSAAVGALATLISPSITKESYIQSLLQTGMKFDRLKLLGRHVFCIR